MTFKEQLNIFLAETGCTAVQLAKITGIGTNTISMWRSGARSPHYDSDALRKLAAGIEKLSAESSNPLAEADVYARLQDTLAKKRGLVTENLNLLLDTMEISSAQLSNALKYDASYISLIRKGKRNPANSDAFAEDVCDYILRKNYKSEKISALAGLLNCSAEELADKSVFMVKTVSWLCEGDSVPKPNPILRFLAKLDEFDLNSYMGALRFDDFAPSPHDIAPADEKYYYGIEQMKQGELDFFRYAALSDSHKPFFMFSTMPMADMAKDLAFGRSWMFGLAFLIKKGIPLQTIHNLDRPFDEMMLGLESWIPLYMTGMVTPYYMPVTEKSVNKKLLYIADGVVLTGECVDGYHHKGRYFLSREAEEVAYQRVQADLLLHKASPLMEIYHAETKAQFEQFLQSDVEIEGYRHNTLCAPPVYTMSEDLLLRILRRNNIDDKGVEAVIAFFCKQCEMTENILKKSQIFDEIQQFEPEEFAEYPPAVPLSFSLFHKDIFYTYEEYEEHLALTNAYAQAKENYTVEFLKYHAFRNIQIHVHEGRWAMVSKGNAPAMHFVIRHNKLRNALENMTIVRHM